MSVTQRVNMRAGLPIVFGDEATRSAYIAEIEAIRAKLKPGQVVVAPRIAVRTRRGTLNTGEVVEPEDILDARDPVTDQVLEVGRLRYGRMLLTGELIEGW